MTARRPGPHPQMWWIRLSPDGTAVVAAGLVFDPDEIGPRADWHEVRLPAVGIADGTPMLAYLARAEDQASFDLWVTTIGGDGAGGESKALAPTGRKLMEGCQPLEPAFSPDGRWLYASIWHGTADKFRLERFAVSSGDHASASSGCPRRPSAGRQVVRVRH